MSATHDFIVHLPEELAVLIEDAVHQGQYANPSDMIVDALRDWNHDRSDAAEGLRAICRQAQADARPGVAPEPVFARLEQRYEAVLEPER